MKKRFGNLGLVSKITWMITCVLILPTTLICGFYYYSYRQSLLKDSDTFLKEEMTRVRRVMDENLDLAENIMKEIAYDQELLYFLDEQNTLSEREMDLFFQSIQEKWIKISYAYPNMFSKLNVYASNPQLQSDHNWKFTLYPLNYFYDLQAEEKSEDICYGTPKEKNFIANEENKTRYEIMNGSEMILPVYLKIRNVRTDRVIGIVELDMPVEKLVDSRNLKSIEEESFLFLDDGMILYGTDKKASYEKEMISDVSVTESVQRVEKNGILYRGLAEQCSRTGFKRCVFMEEDYVTASAKQMIWKVGMVAFLGIFCMMIMTHFLIKSMLNRLVVMDEVMGKVETGDFNVFIEDDGYNDEVSRMKRRFNTMTLRLQNVLQQVVEREKAQKDAELRALQAQINPHFLYNTLESMRMQCEIDRYYKIGNSLLALGEIFRYTIKWQGYEVPFSLEWKNLKNYVSLMALRLDEDFSYELQCDPRAEQVIVPKMILQPIVENSFLHGFKGVEAPWELKVEARMEKNCLTVIITDNGSGVPEDELESLQKNMRLRHPVREEAERRSIGIVNVLQRMDMICKEGSDIEISNGTDGGIYIEIRIVTEAENVSDIGSR